MQPVLKHGMLCWIAAPEACDDAVVQILCEERIVLSLQPSDIVTLNLSGPMWTWLVIYLIYSKYVINHQLFQQGQRVAVFPYGFTSSVWASWDTIAGIPCESILPWWLSNWIPGQGVCSHIYPVKQFLSCAVCTSSGTVNWLHGCCESFERLVLLSFALTALGCSHLWGWGTCPYTCSGPQSWEVIDLQLNASQNKVEQSN